LIDEALEVFRKIYDKEGEELVVSKHIPKDGTYILVNIKSGKIMETLNISYDKKTKKIDGELNQYYSYFRAFDYYSNLVDMNKPMDPKKTIHSNQIYSFFIKKESIRENKLTKAIIEGYKKNLLNPEEKYNSKEGKELYKNVAEKLPKIEKDIVEDIFLWIEDNVNGNLLENDNKKDYLKIFFVEEDLDKSLEVFKNEHKRYLIPNIFNSNDYNKKIGETIYGLSNNNMGLNAKKAFLENKTRRISTPYLVNTDEILLQYVFYNYLLPEVKQGNYFIYFTENEIIPKTYKEGCPNGAKYLLNASYSKDVDIKNFNVVSKDSSEEKIVNLKKILYRENSKSKIKYANYDKMMIMETIDVIFYNNSLFDNIFNNIEEIKVKVIELKKLLINYREGLYKWFYLNDKLEIKKNIKKLYLDSIIVNIKNQYDESLINEQFNLGFSLEKYFYGKSELMEEIMNVKEVFLNHTLSEEDWEFLNDDEYFWAIGQLLAYINNRRNIKIKNLTFIEQIFFIRDINIFKERVFNIIISYGHLIESKKVKRVVSNVNIYQPQEIKKYILLAGFTADIVLYSTDTNKEEEE